MQDFFQDVELTNIDLEKIKRNTDEITLAYQIALRSTEENVRNEQDVIINRLTASTNEVSLRIRDRLQMMDENTNTLESKAPPGSGDLRMRRINQAALTKKFSDRMEAFKKVQSDAHEHKQSEIRREYQVSTLDLSTANVALILI